MLQWIYEVFREFRCYVSNVATGSNCGGEVLYAANRHRTFEVALVVDFVKFRVK